MKKILYQEFFFGKVNEFEKIPPSLILNQISWLNKISIQWTPGSKIYLNSKKIIFGQK